jgi:hypothetical protein
MRDIETLNQMFADFASERMYKLSETQNPKVPRNLLPESSRESWDLTEKGKYVSAKVASPESDEEKTEHVETKEVVASPKREDKFSFPMPSQDDLLHVGLPSLAITVVLIYLAHHFSSKKSSNFKGAFRGAGNSFSFDDLSRRLIRS